MKGKLLILMSVLFFVSCSSDGQNKRVELKSSIAALNVSLKIAVQKEMKGEGDGLAKELLVSSIKKNLQFYKNYPKDDYADSALHRVAALYRQLMKPDSAAIWRDSLLMNYPNSPFRRAALELQMNYYDFNHYNRDKITYYIHQLLALDNLPAEKKKQLEFRLKHIDLTFQELIKLQSEKAHLKTDTTTQKATAK